MYETKSLSPNLLSLFCSDTYAATYSTLNFDLLVPIVRPLSQDHKLG